MSHNAPTHRSLLGGPEPVLLPPDHPDVAAAAALAAGTSVRDAVGRAPASSYLWALLAEEALAPAGGAAPDPVAAYAYARTGYHRGLDALRRAGWRGQGPVPVEHVPNQGFLRAVLALSEAAAAIGEADEAQRCVQLLVDSGTTADAVAALR
ncbi:DUF3151 domain-containing protein [Pengzhenrongella sicca]|uniref:DUF3151 domain-containing protein n=1 Tax=Pengzhenrongella sicca TaxID=2819238 RepID=A0A8A4ZDZ8_9MICO|nr:DUF3151 domain-containing protein [Pengzhenrongella sicca]QTE29631.1 DUF3151 domain-containing protein [Pengzhenrongella sicca]